MRITQPSLALSSRKKRLVTQTAAAGAVPDYRYIKITATARSPTFCSWARLSASWCSCDSDSSVSPGRQ